MLWNDSVQSGSYNVELVRRRMSKLLEKYYSGLWMSKLPEFYSDMFKEILHPHALIDMVKWTDICMVSYPLYFFIIWSSNNSLFYFLPQVHHFYGLAPFALLSCLWCFLWPLQIEKPSITRHSDCLIYPPLPPKPSVQPVTPPSNLNTARPPVTSHASTPKQNSLTSTNCIGPTVLSCKPASAPLFHNSTVLPLTPSFDLTNGDNVGCQVRQNLPTTLSDQNFQQSALSLLSPVPQHSSNFQTGPEILTPLKVTFSPPFSSTPHPPPTLSVGSAEVCERIKEILCHCGHGVWASALPKLYMDTYKMSFPEHILDNLSLLLDVCRVEYPLPHDKTKVG